MVVAHADFDRKLFKFATAILLLCMTFRHAMFYLDFGRINTEMGFDQSLFGVFLIPVTASFGCIFFWERSRTHLKSVDIVRLVLIGMVPLLLALSRHDLQSIFSYSIETLARRPSFLILLPIILSVLVSHVFKLSPISLILIFIVKAFFGDIFVIHYACIFLTYAVLQTLPQYRKYQRSFASVALFLGSVFVVVLFDVNRVGFVLELLLAIGFVGTIVYCSSCIKSLADTVTSTKFIDQLNVFYFYLVQAVAFTIATQFKGLISAWAFIALIFLFSLVVAYYLRKAETGVVNAFNPHTNEHSK